MSFTILEGILMKQVYEAPKAVKHNFEAKDIITASATTLVSHKINDGTNKIMTISWGDWTSSST